MNHSLARVALIAAMAMVGVSTPSTLAVPPGTLYYLRAPSTDQEGCIGTFCACLVLEPEPMRGTFVLRQAVPDPDPAAQNYTIENARFRVPALNRTFLGTGTYQLESGLPGSVRMDLNMVVDDTAQTRHWSYGARVFTAHPPIIETWMSLDTDCFNMALSIKATPFRSDWNADGAITNQDVFEFLNAWFASDGDTDEDGQTTIGDIFDFLNAWMAGE